MGCMSLLWFFFFKQKTAYEMRISDWSSDVCSSDLLDCYDATCEHPGGLALACSRAKVEGMFLLGSTKIVGEVNLNGMRVSALRDDEGSWEGAQGKLWLDGFTYLRFDGHAPTDARTRIAWLSKQVPEHVGKDFR